MVALSRLVSPDLPKALNYPGPVGGISRVGSTLIPRMGGPETLEISIYGADRKRILLVQCTLNGTRCAVSLISFDRLLCLQGASRQQ